jgi:UDP-3-O-[3-hydroxymyristoyl] glucosamine N-acyltransferase
MLIQMGDYNVVEPKASLAAGTVVGNGCVIGTACELPSVLFVDLRILAGATVSIAEGTSLDDHVVVFQGSNGTSHVAQRTKAQTQDVHATNVKSYREILTDPDSRCFLGNYHHMKT